MMIGCEPTSEEHGVPRKVCNVIIYGGSCENMVAKEMVDKLKNEKHPHPEKISWFREG